MKKRVLILAGIVIIGMSGLSHVALSLSDDPQWTPYVLSWSQKLPAAKKKKRVAKADPISICSEKPFRKKIALQR